MGQVEFPSEKSHAHISQSVVTQIQIRGLPAEFFLESVEDALLVVFGG
jgi:hypothetical protein